ncbi:hypothetical protein IMSAGC003_03862 [Lachnospiraceae bacterium]|nr:hypothetical protein IMSAGC003_03862 [Lachnospiraceae bacterium]
MNEISIHTPARGVTIMADFSTAGTRISIHTPARGVTDRALSIIKIRANFNPHSRTGSDDSQTARAKETAEFQSTLPHGE